MKAETLASQPLEGFADPVHDGQRVFRAVLEAMSHPGKVVRMEDLGEAPVPLNRASAAICMSLVDFETPLWADAKIAESGRAMNHLRFHCGCPVTTDPKAARTALVSDPSDIRSFERFNIGTDERPDLSTTVIVQVEGLRMGEGVRLSGPGIDGMRRLNVQGVDALFWVSLKANNALFPRGVDLILTAGDELACLPRTTLAEA